MSSCANSRAEGRILSTSAWPTARDALAEPIPAQPIPEVTDLRALPVGRREDGGLLELRLHGTHLLIAGATGAGKGSWLWSLVRALLPAMAELLEDAVADMQARAARFAGRQRDHNPTGEHPFVVILVDEIAFPSGETVNSYLDAYLIGATRGRRASTRRNYEDAFRPVRERLGARPLQSITKADIEELTHWMLTAGRRRGGKPGTGLSGRTARLTLGRLSAALEMAVLEGKLVRNVARLVKPPEHTRVSGRHGARPRSRSFSPRLLATGCTRPGACPSTACGAAKSSAYAGRTSTWKPRR